MRDRTILVTGGTGSFGKAFIKEALLKEPKQIRVYSRDELKQAQMKEEIGDKRVEWLIGDIRDSERLEMALDGVDVCIHAAAMKRIEKCEKDPQEAIKTNVIGSMNVANACLKRNVKHSIFISTDKASAPVNLYGATKMVAEKHWIRANCYRGLNHPTKFSVVRYGNVVNSRGSVIPMFKEQAKEGVIRVNHPEMTRFLITLNQAVSLVELATEVAQGGEIFLPTLKSIDIVALAKAVSESAYIYYTSPRAGEKIHEQLFNDVEAKRITIEDGYAVIHPEDVTWPYLFPADFSPQVPSTSFDAPRFSAAELKVMVNG